MPFTKTFHGFIENTTDTLLIIEACRNGLLPTINRRLIERERNSIKSGTIIVFDESESGIKRWTDGFLWSPSRILGNFLVYRELANRENRRIEDDYSLSNPRHNLYNDDTGSSSVSPTLAHQQEDDSNLALLHQRERALVGSLTTANTSYNFKKNGLIKKTIRIMVNGNYLHVVSYYSKNDVLNNILPTPSASPQLACLQISADLMPHLQGYANTPHAPSLINSSNNRLTQAPTRKRSKSSDEETDQKIYSSNSRARINSYDASCQQQQDTPRPSYQIGYASSPSNHAPYHHATTASNNIPSMLPTQQQQQSPMVYNMYYGGQQVNNNRSSSILDSNHNNGNTSDSYYSSTRSTPFTELPPPLQSHSYSDFHAVTTAKAPGYANKPRKLFGNSGGSNSSSNNNSTSDPLSPSPSPTPSPPTTLPVVSAVTPGCGDTNNRYNHYFNSTTTSNNNIIDRPTDTFDHYRNNRLSALDNY